MAQNTRVTEITDSLMQDQNSPVAAVRDFIFKITGQKDVPTEA
jgi:hypothetical protein